ncbi:MAG: hypothetical protein FJX76_09605 [Armatimonadetes bacterium]|nr:hypothetical protein [Armatimonadota bacterium]
MQAATSLLSEMFLLVLCAVVCPGGAAEMRVDVVRNGEVTDVFLISRAGKGLKLREVGEHGVVMSSDARRVDEAAHVYDIHVGGAPGPSERVDINASLQGFQDVNLHDQGIAQWKTPEGSSVRVERGGEMMIVQPSTMPGVLLIVRGLSG